jgi:hypothetical protein
MRNRNEDDNPESFLAVAGAILAVMVILIALAVGMVAASGADHSSRHRDAGSIGYSLW